MTTILSKVLFMHFPDKHLREMKSRGTLIDWLPEIDRLSGIAQPPLHHPEGDVFEHTMQVLAEMKKLTRRPERLFAALVHDVGKGTTPIELLPKHHNHEKNGVPLVESISERLSVPANWLEAARYGTEYHGRFHRILEMRPVRVVDFLHAAANSTLGIEGFAQLGLADHRGRNNADGAYANYDAWLEMWDSITSNPALLGERPDDTRKRHGNSIREIQERYNGG